jgi:hypothetical protein
MKKAQLALFVIIGLLLLLLYALALYLMSHFKRAEIPELDFDTMSINAYIADCMGDIAERAIILIGNRGGTLSPSRAISTVNGIIGVDVNQSTERAKKEIERYVTLNIYQCMEALQQKWDVKYGNPQVDVELTRETVDIYLNMPVTVTREQHVLTSKDFFYAHNIRLRRIINNAEKITRSYFRNDKLIDIDMISSFEEWVKVYPYQNATVFAIDDPLSKTKRGQYRFTFGLE